MLISAVQIFPQWLVSGYPSGIEKRCHSQCQRVRAGSSQPPLLSFTNIGSGGADIDNTTNERMDTGTRCGQSSCPVPLPQVLVQGWTVWVIQDLYKEFDIGKLERSSLLLKNEFICYKLRASRALFSMYMLQEIVGEIMDGI